MTFLWVMEVFSTILAGTAVVIVSQFKLKLYIEPAIELKKAMADVSHELLFYHAKLDRHSDWDEKISAELKRCSAKLRSSDSIVPKSRWFRKIFGVPEREQVLKACHQINLISSNMLNPEKRKTGETYEALKEIERLLGVATRYSESRD